MDCVLQWLLKYVLKLNALLIILYLFACHKTRQLCPRPPSTSTEPSVTTVLCPLSTAPPHHLAAMTNLITAHQAWRQTFWVTSKANRRAQAIARDAAQAATAATGPSDDEQPKPSSAMNTTAANTTTATNTTATNITTVTNTTAASGPSDTTNISDFASDCLSDASQPHLDPLHMMFQAKLCTNIQVIY